MQPIANKTDIEKYLPVAKGCKANDIEFYIAEEQSITLKKWLGDCFFAEWETKKDEPKFQTLLNGGSWGTNRYCDGLIRVLSYLAYGEYVVLGNYTDTAFGVKIKNFQDGLPTPPEMLETMRARYRNKAKSYFESCKEYLCANKDYFCYKGDCGCDSTPTQRAKVRTLYSDSHDHTCADAIRAGNIPQNQQQNHTHTILIKTLNNGIKRYS